MRIPPTCLVDIVRARQTLFDDCFVRGRGQGGGQAGPRLISLHIYFFYYQDICRTPRRPGYLGEDFFNIVRLYGVLSSDLAFSPAESLRACCLPILLPIRAQGGRHRDDSPPPRRVSARPISAFFSTWPLVLTTGVRCAVRLHHVLSHGGIHDVRLWCTARRALVVKSTIACRERLGEEESVFHPSDGILRSYLPLLPRTGHQMISQGCYVE